MRINKITDRVIYQDNSDWSDFKIQTFPKLIEHFKDLGLIGDITNDSIIFEKLPQKPDDFGRFWQLRNMFSIIRLAETRLFRPQLGQKVIEISIDATYLFFLSFGLGICFCLGLGFYIDEIGVLTYISAALSIMTLSLTIGYIYIRIVLTEIIKQIKITR